VFRSLQGGGCGEWIHHRRAGTRQLPGKGWPSGRLIPRGYAVAPGRAFRTLPHVSTSGPAEAGSTTRHPLVTGVREVGTLLLGTCRVFARHWPTLLAVGIGAYVVREGVGWLAVRLSRGTAIGGYLVVAASPVVLLVAVAVMLRIVERSLPAVNRPAALLVPPAAPSRADPSSWAPPTPPDRRSLRRAGRRVMLMRAGALAVPFLVLYTSYHYLEDDLTHYAAAVTDDEIFNSDVFGGADLDAVGRLPFDITLGVVIVLVVSFALRRFVFTEDNRERHAWMGVPATYVELLWLGLFTILVNRSRSTLESWWSGRVAAGWLESAGHAIVAATGPVEPAVRAAAGWLHGTASRLDTVAVLPLAWLVVASVFYQVEMQARATGVAAVVPTPFTSRWNAVSDDTRRLVRWLGRDLQERFVPIWHGIVVFVRAGLTVTLPFFVAFLIVRAVPAALWELERLAIGPHDLFDTWAPVQQAVDQVNQAASTVLLVCLVAVTVDLIVTKVPVIRARGQDEAQAAGSAAPDGLTARSAGAGPAGR
jgi:hypothetical protein